MRQQVSIKLTTNMNASFTKTLVLFGLVGLMTSLALVANAEGICDEALAGLQEDFNFFHTQCCNHCRKYKK